MESQSINTYNKLALANFSLEHGLPPFDHTTPLINQQEYFAFPIPERVIELSSGIMFCQKTVSLPDGAFTRSYEIVTPLDNFQARPTIFTRGGHLSPLRKTLIDPKTLAAINAGFFYLTDELQPKPIEYSLNLVIRDGLTTSLPVRNDSILIESCGKLEPKEVKAQGIIRIGDNSEIFWKGSNTISDTIDPEEGVLYSNGSCSIQHNKSPETGSVRVLEQEKSRTLINPEVIDLMIREIDGKMVITDMNPGGNSDYLGYNYVVQLNARTIADKAIRTGDTVQPLTLDDINLANIRNGISIGPSVYHFMHCDDHPINHDQSLGSKPPFTERRMARSVIYLDKDHLLHLRVFDGSPKTQEMQGLTPLEVASLIPKDTVQ